MANSAFKILRATIGFTFALVLLCQLSAFGQNIPPKPDPPRLVNDYSQVITNTQINELENKLVAYYNKTSIQIAVIYQNGTTRDLNEYCTAIIDAWGIGTKGKDNGVLVFVDPERRQTYIATGRGTEGWLPDVLAKRIIDKYMLPAFKQEGYYRGVDKATDVIMKLGDGEYSADDVGKPEGEAGGFVFALLLFVMISVFIFIRLYGRRGGFGRTFSGGDFSGGGGGFSGGGGFGGFGGGGSGGGGAGGGW